MYLHAYGKSVIEIATNTIAFVTEFLPFVIKIHGGVTNLRPAVSRPMESIVVSRLFGEKMRGNCLRSFLRTFIVFFNVQENNRFKTVNFFGFYIFEDVKELLYH